MKNEYKITKKLLTSWCIESRFSGISLVLFVIWCILALFFAFLLLALIYIEYDWYYIFLLSFLLFTCIYKMILERLIVSFNQYKFLSNSHGSTEWLRTIEFSDESIVITDGAITTTTYQYSSIKKIKEKKNKIWLIFDNKSILRLYKDTFVEGSWEKCKELISLKNTK